MVFAARNVKKLFRKVAVLSVLFLWSCRSGETHTGEDRHAADTVYVLPWEQLEVYMNAAPSPVQVATWLRQERVPFYKDMLHDPTLAGRYSGLQGAANLGIYLTDMAYAHATNHYQEAYEYLSAVNRLATLYGLGDIFSLERIKSLDKLQDNPDSMQKLLTQYYSEVQTRLSETGQQPMLRHMILGGWTESLHIILALLEKNASNQPLAEMILLQKGLTPLLIKLYSADTSLSPVSHQIVTQLEDMQEELNALPIGEGSPVPSTQVNKGVIQMKFQQKTSLTPEQIKRLKERLTSLRHFIMKV
jgi:hypothetical protein